MTERSPMTEWDIFPFEGDIRLKELAPPVIPEPARSGEPGGSPCGACSRPDEHCLWVDDDWRALASPSPGAVPVVILETRAHHDLNDMPAELSSALGPMLQRIESALLATGRVGRVHVNRWGDGSAHFHIWLFARPLGATQLLGVFLPVWTSMLPPMGADEWWEMLDAVGDGLAAGGGRRHLRRPP
jgi:diadenosine tetraphosphate (Ap4A) HIT family hydrolase